MFTRIFFILIIFFKLNRALYILSGIKILNKFLYSTRFKEYNKQSKINTCSLNDGPNCYFSENKYTQKYNKIEENDIKNKDWVNFYNKTKNYHYQHISRYLVNYTNNYIKKNEKKIDKEQNSQGEAYKYIMTFDNYDEYTIKKDTYYNEKSIKEIFFNKEFILDIKGKLKLSYDNDESEYYLTVLDKDYPTTTFGTIESKYISISFGGKPFICHFSYIKAHDKNNKSEQIYFYGYIGKQLIFNYSYNDNKERKEKWLKVFFPMPTPINKLIISGPYDIDNISFTFPNKKYEDSNLYKYKNKDLLIKDEEL